MSSSRRRSARSASIATTSVQLKRPWQCRFRTAFVQGGEDVEAEVRGAGCWGQGGQEADEGVRFGEGEGGARLGGCVGFVRDLAVREEAEALGF